MINNMLGNLEKAKGIDIIPNNQALTPINYYY